VEEDELPVEEEPVCLCYDEAGVTVCTEGCECACHVVEEAVCLCYDEAGVMVCTEGCECACHVVVEEADPYIAEVTAWAEETGATPEMVERALNASSLESIVIEGDKLIYVRTGETVAYYDAESGELREPRYYVLFAYLDQETLTIVPLHAEENDDAAAGSQDAPELLPEL